MTLIPDHILIDPEFFGRNCVTERVILEARVLAIFRDSTGDQWVAFEMADMCGVFNIHLGSNFFRGWASNILEVFKHDPA